MDDLLISYYFSIDLKSAIINKMEP